MTPISPEIFWMRRARSLRRQVNLARWLERLSPAAIGLGLAGIPAVLVARGYGISPAYPLLGGALALAVAGAVARRRVRAGFESDADALARLDFEYGLHNRLSSARAGVGPWPEPVQAPVLRWRRSRATDLSAIAAVLLLAACVAPIGRIEEAPPAGRPEAPPAIRDLRAMIRRLRDEKAVDPKAIEALEKRAEALMKQPESAWYDTTTLEASEHLRERTAETLRDLDKDLAALKAVTDRVAESGELMPEELSTQLAQNLAEALEGLDLSTLPPTKELREQLKNLTMGNLKPMDKAALDALRQALAAQRRRLRKAGAEGKSGSAASRKAAPDGLPIFIFAAGPKGPEALIKLALGADAEAKVDTGVPAATEDEVAEIRAASQKAPPRLHLQTGCKPGMQAVGLVPMPRTAGAGTNPAVDDDLLDALEDLVYGDTLAVSESATARAALLAAVESGRLRVTPMALKDCKGACGKPGDGQCEKTGDCEQPGGAMVIVMGGGAGGPGGGGGSAPLAMGDKTAAEANRTEALGGKDRSHDALGELNGLTTGKHKVDTSAYRGPVTGGALATEGEGSEAVWRDNLTPEERETLRKYFK